MPLSLEEYELEPATHSTGGRPHKSIMFKLNETGCFICTSHKPNSSGTIVLRRDGEDIPMHRWLYEKKHGELNNNFQVVRTCKNRLCMNLEHMIVREINVGKD